MREKQLYRTGSLNSQLLLIGYLQVSRKAKSDLTKMFSWKAKSDQKESSDSPTSDRDEDRSSKKRKHKEKRRKKEKKHKKEKDVGKEQSPTPRKEKGMRLKLKSAPSHEPTLVDNLVLGNPQDDQLAPSALTTKSLLKRDDWMNSEGSVLFPSVSREDIKGRPKDARAAERAAKLEMTEKIYQARELNPNLRKEDAGAPVSPVVVHGCMRPPDDPKLDKTPLPVGDGGVSWLRRAYQRMHEQAKETGRSVEEIAAERWGSLHHLQTLLEAAEEKESAGRPQNSRQSTFSRTSGSSDRYNSTPQRDERISSSGSDNQRYSSSRTETKGSFLKPVHRNDSERSFVKPGEEIPTAWKSRDQTRFPVKTKIRDQPQKEDHPTISKVATKELGEPLHLSESELNQLNAKILRAELLGDTETVTKLKEKISVARKASKATLEPVSRQKEVVVLSRSHAKGFDYPVKSGEPAAHGKRPKIPTHNKAGERERYFADDDKFSLSELVSMERMQSAEDQNAMFARLAGKSTEKTDDEYSLDDAFMKKALNKESLDQLSLHDRDKAIMEHRQMGSALSSCFFCLEGVKMNKHLVISIGKKVVLMLPPFTGLADGHCLICPISHNCSGTTLDEDVWEEVQQFRRALCQMFEKEDMDCVFMETAMNLKNHPHMKLECIPLDKEIGSTAPMYFKKAIMESEGEWTNNVKLVDLSRKDIRHAVPKNLPYFSVDFGMQGGYAHVIEDEKRFPIYFGKEIIGGMLDAEPRLWLKSVPQNFNEQMKQVHKFSEMWKPFEFDCNKPQCSASSAVTTPS